jgi:heterodisulfide reductase subunit B
MIAQMSGTQPVEFHDCREKTSCSGQGGCYSIIDKKAADEITKERLSEAYEKDISTILTQCPTCVFKMRQNSNKLVVKDLISYLNDCIEGTDE